ncbi:MAG TPA: hypothetical protein VFS22_11020 [Flavisolibacter sp.]|nr:hypothetical protein [Flavisolibacter sp.]
MRLLAVAAPLILSTSMAAQKTELFDINLPAGKIRGGFYNQLRFMDSRPDTVRLGVVRTGPLKEKTLVFAKRPLSEQVTDVFNAYIDTFSQNRTMLFQLRNLTFLEYPGIYADKGFFFFKASLYYQQGEGYKRILTFDTLVETSRSTYILFNEGSRIINNFLRNNLWRAPRERETYTYDQIRNIDSIEKSKIKAYIAPVLKDGMYRSFQSFMNQEPDFDVIVKRTKNKILSVRLDGGGGKTFKVKHKEVYAIVDQGQAFIMIENDYCPLNRIDGDFYFTGKAKVGASVSDLVGAAFLFATIGHPASDDTSKTLFEMKLDHTKGGFIRLRKAKASL